MLPAGNRKCDPKTWSKYDKDCCRVDDPCGEGEGDCDENRECVGDLVCGKDNCGEEFPLQADCCELGKLSRVLATQLFD